MKKLIIVLTSLMLSSVGNMANAAKKIKTTQDSISYALGYVVGGQQLSNFLIEKYGCDKELFLKAVTDAINGDSSVMTQTKAAKVMERADYDKHVADEKKKDVAYKKQKSDNDKYLNNNLKRTGFEEIENSWNKNDKGIQRRIIKVGKGETPTTSSAVKFNYMYRLTDGTVISKSDADMPTEGIVGNLLPGLQDALTHMPVGSKWEVVIPSELGFDKEEQYYDNGKVMIPANSILIFEIELLNCGMPEDLDF